MISLKAWRQEKGGGGGIRTPGTLITYGCFQDSCNQPLCHSSENCCERYLFCTFLKKRVQKYIPFLKKKGFFVQKNSRMAPYFLGRRLFSMVIRFYFFTACALFSSKNARTAVKDTTLSAKKVCTSWLSSSVAPR